MTLDDLPSVRWEDKEETYVGKDGRDEHVDVNDPVGDRERSEE